MQIEINNASADKKLKMKTLIVWLSVLTIAAFAASTYSLSTDPVSMKVFPSVPKEGEPIILTLDLQNNQLTEKEYTYELYANGEEVLRGVVDLAPLSSRSFRYAYKNPLKLGEQINFVAKVTTPSGVSQKILSVPAYPPQVWTSFVSFATFSTSVASFSTSMGITSMASYKHTFGLRNALNVGVIFSIVLIGLLIHVELTEPFMGNRGMFGRLRTRFTGLSAILFVIFMGMVLTQIVMIIGRLA